MNQTQDDNTHFLLASAQLFPLPFIEPAVLDGENAVLNSAKEAFIAYKEGDLDRALALYSAAIEQFPDEAFFYACRSLLNQEMDDEEGAFYDYQVAKGLDFNYHAFLEWVENRPDEKPEVVAGFSKLKDLLDEALTCIQQFDYEQALTLYDHALQAFTLDIDVLVYRAALYTRLLRYDKALSDLNEAIVEDVQHFQAYLFRAQLFKAVKETEKAQSDFDQAVALQPVDVSVAYEERANFLVERGHFAEALSDFNRLIELLPEDFYVFSLRADLFEKMENWQAALEDYSKAIALNPYYSDLYAYRASMREQLGDHAGAREDRRIYEELEQEE